MQSYKKNESMFLSDMDIQWHPAFYAAAELELSANRADLYFQREYNLSKKPLQIDLLVIRKPDNVRIENEIGSIFRQYNIVEYKSPDDGLSIDDFFKAVGYAYIYKGLGETVDQIPADQLTVSLFRENYPRELFCNLEKYNCSVKRERNGIYYIEGLYIPAQVIVTKELDGQKHRSLKVLSKHAREEDIRGFAEEMQKFTEQGERENVDAVLQVSVAANSDLYDKMTRRFSDMNDAMRWLMRNEIEAGVQQGMRQGMQQGMLKQAKDTAYELCDMGLPVDKIARAVKVSLDTVQGWLDERAALVE